MEFQFKTWFLDNRVIRNWKFKKKKKITRTQAPWTRVPSNFLKPYLGVLKLYSGVLKHASFFFIVWSLHREPYSGVKNMQVFFFFFKVWLLHREPYSGILKHASFFKVWSLHMEPYSGVLKHVSFFKVWLLHRKPYSGVLNLYSGVFYETRAPWTRVPCNFLKPYSGILKPYSGVLKHANFFKVWSLHREPYSGVLK